MDDEFDISIRPLRDGDEAWTCTDIMASADAWTKLGYGREYIHRNVVNPMNETYVALAEEQVIGVIVLCMKTPLVKGYISALAVRSDWRGRGVGRKLIEHAEQRVFRESPNLFLCVSSFNEDARRFYERCGFTAVGELNDFVIAGAAEVLMRKTIGAWTNFTKK